MTRIYAFMYSDGVRTTVDLPESLLRKTKSTAALRGSSMKDLIVRAIEHEVNGPDKGSDARQSQARKAPGDPLMGRPQAGSVQVRFR